MESQTPLAHVNVAASARNTPNIAYPDADRDPRITALVGKLVRFEAADGAFTIKETTESEAQVFWQNSQRPRLTPTFDPLDETVAAALKQKALEMSGTIKLRLRSSTNAEDLTAFSGAGLYKSVSAYAAGNDKPIDRQIRNVWASVWQWRAYGERRFWNMDHNAVKMGVAVHPAYPDEAANGVLITRNLTNPMENGLYVNVQPGETSVTNPKNGATPEISVLIPVEGNALQKNTLAFSSLSQGTPILTDEEERQLAAAALRINAHFQQFHDQMPLEIEFKFHGTARTLVIKQVRPYLQ